MAQLQISFLHRAPSPLAGEGWGEGEKVLVPGAPTRPKGPLTLSLPHAEGRGTTPGGVCKWLVSGLVAAMTVAISKAGIPFLLPVPSRRRGSWAIHRFGTCKPCARFGCAKMFPACASGSLALPHGAERTGLEELPNSPGGERAGVRGQPGGRRNVAARLVHVSQCFQTGPLAAVVWIDMAGNEVGRPLRLE